MSICESVYIYIIFFYLPYSFIDDQLITRVSCAFRCTFARKLFFHKRAPLSFSRLSLMLFAAHQTFVNMGTAFVSPSLPPSYDLWFSLSFVDLLLEEPRAYLSSMVDNPRRCCSMSAEGRREYIWHWRERCPVRSVLLV